MIRFSNHSVFLMIPLFYHVSLDSKIKKDHRHICRQSEQLSCFMDDDITKVNRVQNRFKNDYDANGENFFSS